MGFKYRDMTERLLQNSVALENGCWYWLGKKERGGYGRINLYMRDLGRTVVRQAHRVSYEAFIGPIPDGHELDHTCQNEYCIHPNHLDPVPGLENIKRRDAVRKNRK